jgi:hypothetical protein
LEVHVVTAIHVSQQMAIAPRLALRPSQTLVAATTLLALPSDRPIAVCVLAASLAKAFGALLAALGGRPRFSFLITARHRFAEIDHAVDVLAAATAWRARRLGGWR